MTPRGVTARFPPRRLSDGSTLSVRAVGDKPYLVLTLADGREASRRITPDVATAYWELGRNFVVEIYLDEMRSELGVTSRQP
jgi:hypothetical protein